MSSSDSMSSPQPSAPPSSPQVDGNAPNPQCECLSPCPCPPPCTCEPSTGSGLNVYPMLPVPETSSGGSGTGKPETMEGLQERKTVTFSEQPAFEPVTDSCKLRKKGVYCLTHYVLPAIAGAAVLFGAFRLVRFARTYRA